MIDLEHHIRVVPPRAPSKQAHPVEADLPDMNVLADHLLCMKENTEDSKNSKNLLTEEVF